MKQYLYFSFPSLALVLLFMSCSKEEVAPVIYSQNSPDETYLLSLKNDVLFVVQQQDLNTGQVSGWFIDKHGAVNSFEAGPAFEGSWVRQERVSALKMASTATPVNLTPEELAPKARLIGKLNSQQLNEAVMDPSATSNLRILALYAWDYGQNPNACSERPGVENWDEELSNGFELLLLKSEGRVNQMNLNEKAATLLEWLLQIQQSAGL